MNYLDQTPPCIAIPVHLPCLMRWKNFATLGPPHLTWSAYDHIEAFHQMIEPQYTHPMWENHSTMWRVFFHPLNQSQRSYRPVSLEPNCGHRFEARSPPSRPILERLGDVQTIQTTPEGPNKTNVKTLHSPLFLNPKTEIPMPIDPRYLADTQIHRTIISCKRP